MDFLLSKGIQIINAIKKRYGNEGWTLRKLSNVRKNYEYPSLSLSSELYELGLKPGDYVVVFVSKKAKKIVIEPIDNIIDVDKMVKEMQRELNKMLKKMGKDEK